MSGADFAASMAGVVEREWVNVANDLLRKCNIDERVNRLSDCGAKFFVHLYESILGEKVPDFITIPTCQEDNAHNVQAVIDSLALDYLQISLSHITGENIVKGNKESIKNLLEIFDGLLEYLTEEITETTSQNGGIKQETEEEVQTAYPEKQDGHDIPAPILTQQSGVGSSQSSETLVTSWDADGSESTSELIKLGDTAYLFSLRNEAKSSELSQEPLSSSAKKLGEPIRPAIALQPPYQPSLTRAPYIDERNTESRGRQSPPPLSPVEPQELTSSVPAEPPEQKSVTFSEDISCLLGAISDLPAGGNQSAIEAGIIDKPVPDDAGKEMDESSHHCKEDVLPQFTSVQTKTPKQRNLLSGRSQNEHSALTSSLVEDSFHHRKAKRKLYEMSNKLSHRLNELDAMLKQALGTQSKEQLSDDEDTLSQHSDSIMDYHKVTTELDAQLSRREPSRRRSLSASPPLSHYQPSYKLDSPFRKDAKGPVERMRVQLQDEQDQRKLRAKLLTKTYNEELRAYEADERYKLAKLKAKAKEMEQKYKANTFKESPRISHSVKNYSRKYIPRHPKRNQRISKGGFVKPKQTAPMKVKENDLLPLLLEDFPHLHISRPVLNKMWQQQLSQIKQLKPPRDRNQLKLQSEVLEILKKHDILVDLLKKEQAHNRRLHEFKQRIHRQKSMQNKMRESRQQIARAKKYYQDYRVQLQAKMMKARTREERIFKHLFEEGLEIQKQRLLELRSYAKEKRAEQKRQYQDELESMENYYKDQFSMLAQAVTEERQEIRSRERVHAHILSKLKCELRSKLEKEIKELQDIITRNDDDSFFRELEADRLKSRLLVASFQYSKNYPFI